MKKFGLGALSVVLACASLRAQEPWDPSFNLLFGSVRGAEEGLMGQDKVLGLSTQGVYPITLKGGLGLDFGYRYLPTMTRTTGAWVLDDKTDGFFASAWYRHELFFEGFYLQAGVRASQMKSARREIQGTLGQDHIKAPSTRRISPVVGLGYRFTDKLSLDLQVSQANLRSVTDLKKTTTLVELAVGIHLGK